MGSLNWARDEGPSRYPEDPFPAKVETNPEFNYFAVEIPHVPLDSLFLFENIPEEISIILMTLLLESATNSLVEGEEERNLIEFGWLNVAERSCPSRNP